MARILAIGPHPDDVEIGMGGTILALLAQGHEVVLCDLTNGEPTPRGTPERRAAGAAEAAPILGGGPADHAAAAEPDAGRYGGEPYAPGRRHPRGPARPSLHPLLD